MLRSSAEVRNFMCCVIAAQPAMIAVSILAAVRAARRMLPSSDPDPIAASDILETPAVVRGFGIIRETDPDFDEDGFRDRVSWLFARLHQALSDQDLGAIRDFTDDTALRCLQRRIDRFARDGRVEEFRDPRISSIGAFRVSRADDMQTVAVHVSATAAIAVTDRDTGALIAPDMFGDGVRRRPLVESWTLTRPVGVAVPDRPRGDTCSYCGAPIEGSPHVCDHCGTDLRGPERDWTILRWEIE